MISQRLEEKVTWTETMQECWEMLKEEFEKEGIRAYLRLDIDEPFDVKTDISNTALAMIVSQKQNVEEQFIAEKGRKTTK